MSSVGARRVTEHKHAGWTHPSVLVMASKDCPVDAITVRAREVVFKGIQAGWAGPPYDPFALAEILKISVEPCQDVVDARTTCNAAGKFRIEFNPNRSPARINFSVAHEIAHTLFPDCGAETRNRYTHTEMKSNDWELEVLCNIGAAEILMPVGSFRPRESTPVSIDTIIALQREFLVSTEAVLLRYAKLTSQQCFVFAAHREERSGSIDFRIDYAIESRTWPVAPRVGLHLPSDTVLGQCTAIGFTAKSEEEWIARANRWTVECLGVAPFPGHTYPRVVGVVRPTIDTSADSPQIQYLKGDATKPRGSGARIIVHVVNNKAITWGGGFASAVRKRWPQAQKDFTQWVFASKRDFHLGQMHLSKLEESLELASLVAQQGYGPSLFPRIQYSALEACLTAVALRAKELDATVHMPRIGCGEAGGDWTIVSELIDETLCRIGVDVTVYDLPSTPQQSKNRAIGPISKN